MEAGPQNARERAGNVSEQPAPDTGTENRQRNPSVRRQQRQRARRAINRNNLRSREGFFMHYLFITLSVRYANYVKPAARRLIEFFTLIKAIMMLLVLIYIHTSFVKDSGNCLNHIDDIWPRTGILKVQVEANTTLPPYQFFFVKKNTDDWAASFESNPYQAIFKFSTFLGKDGLPVSDVDEKGRGVVTQKTTHYNAMKKAHELFGIQSEQYCPTFNSTSQMKKRAKMMLTKRFKKITPEIQFLHVQEKTEIPQWLMIDPSVSDTVAELRMLQMQEVSGFNVGPQPVRAYYAIEYSAEFGYLRLPTVTRHRLGIPVLVVTLDPSKDQCFGKGVRRWMLDTFFGYDDLVMSSIKLLAEKDNKQGGGYLRNLVTGEHYKFITLWVSHASYILAFAVMLIFTLVVTMLLRYSYHQIFVFMVELLHILDTDATPIFPAAPMLTIILALVGTEEIMTEFFHDSTLAFYVILSIWVADQFDAICMHTVVSRRHWVRFFFLYHFAFYAYHYRFNGQFSELALFTSWLFIQHSMFYFFHHYELPAIQRQMRLRQALFQTNMQNTPPPMPESPGGSGDPPADDPGPDSTDGSGQPSNQPSNEVASSGQDNASTSGENNQSLDGSGQADRPNHQQCLNNVGLPALDGRCERAFFPAEFCIIENPESIQDLSEECTKSSSELNGCMTYTKSVPTNTESEEAKEDRDKITQDMYEDFKFVFDNNEVDHIEAGIGHTSVGAKYCNLIFILFFAVVSLIVIFVFAVVLLSHGRVGARSGMQDLNDVAQFVR